MNKYSSKAVKTAATVGMSLAMVLSAAPVMPIMASDDAVVVAVDLKLEDAIEKKDDVEELLNLLGDAKNIHVSDTVGGSGEYFVTDQKKDILFDNLFTQEKDGVTAEDLLKNAYKYASVAGYTTEQTEILKYLVGTKIDGVNGGKAQNAVAHAYALANDVLNDLEAYNGTVTPADVVLYNKVKALLAFKGNVDVSDKLDKIEDLFADLAADVEDYKEDNVGSDAKKFAKALAGEKVAGKSVAELVDDEAALAYTNLSTINAFIAKITKDSYKLDEIKYGDVKNEDVVADYIEGLETIASEMQDVKDLINDTKTEKKAFDKLNGTGGKLDVLVTAINATVGEGKDYVTEDLKQDAIDDAVAAFRTADITALKDYVDAFVNEFWTVTTEQRTSGSYRVKEVNAGLGRYYTFDQAAGAKLHTLMTTLVDSDEEETYYDLLIADAASVDELLKAVTTDIEGITMNSTLTDKQAAKIIAAKKLYQN